MRYYEHIFFLLQQWFNMFVIVRQYTLLRLPQTFTAGWYFVEAAAPELYLVCTVFLCHFCFIQSLQLAIATLIQCSIFINFYVGLMNDLQNNIHRFLCPF